MDDERQAQDGDEPTADGPWSGRGRGARWWVKPTLVSFTTLAAIAVLTLATVIQSPSAHGDAKDTASTSAPSPRPSATPSATPATSPPAPRATTPPPSPSPAPKKQRSAGQAVREAVADLAEDASGSLAVGVTELGGDGDRDTADAVYDGDHAYDTASIVKVDILAALLLQHQHAGTRLTAGQRRLATAMIESSDNTAATELWDAIGRAGGLDTANATLGLRHTDGGSGELWGLTRTTAADQLTLLREVFGDDSVLSAASRAYVASLMGAVEADQNWGVSAAGSAEDGGFALKNGWLQRSATGLWDVNSVGRVDYAGHTLLICVLSDGRPSEAAGISLVERAAAAAARAYAGAAGWR